MTNTTNVQQQLAMMVSLSNGRKNVITTVFGRPTCLQFMRRHFQFCTLSSIFFSARRFARGSVVGAWLPCLGGRYWDAARSCAVLRPIISTHFGEMIPWIVHPTQTSLEKLWIHVVHGWAHHPSVSACLQPTKLRSVRRCTASIYAVCLGDNSMKQFQPIV